MANNQTCSLGYYVNRFEILLFKHTLQYYESFRYFMQNTDQSIC